MRTCHIIVSIENADTNQPNRISSFSKRTVILCDYTVKYKYVFYENEMFKMLDQILCYNI